MAKSRRKERTRISPPDLILIVTEGEKTEPLYFKCFPLHTTKVIRIKGTGTNTMSLISETDKELEVSIKWYQQEYGIRLKDKDILVWCVFDKDSFLPAQFDNAIASARAKGYHVAYSNEAFELWYLLHFDYIDSGMGREQYQGLLSNYLEKPYKKNDPCMYQITKHLQTTAIRNAKALMGLYNPPQPSKDNPSTTVFELVEYLNQFIKGD